MSAFYNVDQPPFNMGSAARAIAAANNGALFDPSDMSTMFQDAAGTTPVTAVEQPVGKILDKSGNGNHATQSITASRPTLSARYNLLTKTEDFSDAVWIKTGTIANNSNNGCVLVEQTTNTIHYLYYTLSGASNAQYTYEVTYSAASTRLARQSVVTSSSIDGFYVDIDTANKLVVNIGNTGAGIFTSYKITDLGGEWFSVSITGIPTTARIDAQFFGVITMRNALTNVTTESLQRYTGDGTSFVKLKNPSLRLGTTSGPYQRVNTATDYDTNPALFPKYLKFDGVDDYLNLPYMGLYANGSATVVMSMARSKTGTIKYALAEGNSAGGENYIPLRLSDYGITSRIVNDTGTTVILTPESAGAPNSILEVITFIDDGGNLKLLKNSQIVNNSNYVRVGTLTLNNLTIGAILQAAVTENMLANMYGLIITKSALTDAQRVRCERFLARKAGVML